MIIDIVSRVDFYSACIFLKDNITWFCCGLFSSSILVYFTFFAVIRLFERLKILLSRFFLTLLSDLLYFIAAKLEFAV